MTLIFEVYNNTSETAYVSDILVSTGSGGLRINDFTPIHWVEGGGRKTRGHEIASKATSFDDGIILGSGAVNYIAKAMDDFKRNIARDEDVKGFQTFLDEVVKRAEEVNDRDGVCSYLYFKFDGHGSSMHSTTNCKIKEWGHYTFSIAGSGADALIDILDGYPWPDEEISPLLVAWEIVSILYRDEFEGASDETRFHGGGYEIFHYNEEGNFRRIPYDIILGTCESKLEPDGAYQITSPAHFSGLVRYVPAEFGFNFQCYRITKSGDDDHHEAFHFAAKELVSQHDIAVNAKTLARAARRIEPKFTLCILRHKNTNYRSVAGSLWKPVGHPEPYSDAVNMDQFRDLFAKPHWAGPRQEV